MAVWCIFALIYIILCILSLVAFIVLRGHRILIVATFLSVLFALIQAAVVIPIIILGNNIDSSSVFPYANTLEGLYTSSTFFGLWSLCLIFLTLTLVLSDRHAAIHSASDGKIASLPTFFHVLNYVAFIITFGLAAIAGGLMYAYRHYIAQSASLINSGLSFDPDEVFGEIKRKFNSYNDAFYVFCALWSLAAFYVVAFSIYVYSAMRKAKVSDLV